MEFFLGDLSYRIALKLFLSSSLTLSLELSYSLWNFVCEFFGSPPGLSLATAC